MICTNCKKEIPDGSKYCYLCGTVFEEKNQKLEKPKKKRKGLMIVLIALVACIVIVGGLIFWYVNVFSKLSYEKELQLEIERLESKEFEIETERMDESLSTMIETPPEIIGKWEFIGQDDCYGYEFLADGTMRYLVQISNSEIDEQTYQYAFMDENTIIYGRNDYDDKIRIAFDEGSDEWCYIDNGSFAQDFNKRDAFGFDAVISEDDPSVVSEFITGKWKGLYDDTVYGFEFFDDGTMQLYTRAEDEDSKISTFIYKVIDSHNLKIEGKDNIKIDYDSDKPEMKIAWNEIWDGFDVVCERTIYYPTDVDFSTLMDKTDMIQNIEEYIEGSLWESTGNLIMPQETCNLAGYPINYYVEQGDTIISFVGGIVNSKSRFKTYGSDEYEWDEGRDTEWIGDPEGYFLYVYRYEEELRGKKYMSSGVYFIKGDMLYYYNSLDDVPCSNMIEYKKK